MLSRNCQLSLARAGLLLLLGLLLSNDTQWLVSPYCFVKKGDILLEI